MRRSANYLVSQSFESQYCMLSEFDKSESTQTWANGLVTMIIRKAIAEITRREAYDRFKVEMSNVLVEEITIFNELANQLTRYATLSNYLDDCSPKCLEVEPVS